MQKIACKFYDILFISDIDQIIQTITTRFKPDKFCIISDENVYKLYEQIFVQKFPQQKLLRYKLLSGETNKNLENIEQFHNYLFKNNFQRTDIIIGFGGGLITDFAGFASSTYMRGIKFISIPTSIIGISDAAIGSKTAINNDFGKNLVGAFYDPALIIVNTNFLATLDDRNFSNGLAEIIKAGLIMDKELFQSLYDLDIKTIRQEQNFQKLQNILKRSMEIKVSVIEEDKLEKDLRKILNFGHTIGHGIEFASKEQLLHGECVSIGMILACDIAQRLNILENPLETIQQIRQCLQNYNLPISIPEYIDKKAIFYYMQSDKKKEQNQIHFVLLKKIGEVYVKTYPISQEMIFEIISDQIQIGSSLNQISNNINPQETKKINLPGSKSIVNRILIIASLSKNVVTINNFLDAEDTNIMLAALQQLKACTLIKRDNKSITIQGNGGILQQPDSPIYTANSGTASRFLSTLLLLVNGKSIMTSCERMEARPMSDLLDCLQKQKNVQINYIKKKGCFPFEIISEQFEGGEIYINGKTSSQFITSLLLSSPYAKNPVKIIINDYNQNEQIVSEPFIEMTIKLMQQCKIHVKRAQRNIFEVSQGIYELPEQFSIEPDAATASYDIAYSILNKIPLEICDLGSNSVQGDIKFIDKLIQSKAQIKINPNSIQILQENNNIELVPSNLDFNDCTDTFMTMAIILSTVEGVSTIRGISNQRLKESNRIYSVIKNLMRCNIFCKELVDGIEIHGKNVFNIAKQQQSQNIKKQKVLIKTYNDHRLAMSFAILGTYYANINYNIQIVIDNKGCVSKTFPEFWDHIKLNYKCQVTGCEENLKANLSNCTSYLEPIFIIGMRGCGKSTMSKMISNKFNLKIVDLDNEITQYIKEKQGIDSIQQFVQKNGWPAFRIIEENILAKIIEEKQNYYSTIISCGGGIIESQANLSLLKNMKYVIWIQRDIQEIKIDIEQKEDQENQLQRPNYQDNESLENQYAKRINLYQACAKAIISVPLRAAFSNQLNKKEYWGQVEKLQKLILRKTIFQDKTYLIKNDSYFVCLYIESVEKLLDCQISYINQNYNALEIRADQFFENKLNQDQSPYSINSNIELFNRIVAKLKLKIRIPLIFTLRTQSQGGYFTLNSNLYYKILSIIRLTYLFEIIDCEFQENTINKFIKFSKKASQTHLILLSKHYIEQIDDNLILKELELIKSNQNCFNILKLALNKECTEKFIQKIKTSIQNLQPNILIKLGEFGKLSRVTNNYLTPVYDQQFGPATGAGQMQKCEIHRLKQELSLLQNYKKIYIFGQDINLSYSPAIHNLAYSQLNIANDHIFERMQVQKVEEIIPFLKQKDFYGACLTMPFKKDLLNYVDKLNDEANEIGVINTIVKFDDQLQGFNTDWYGICKPLQKRLLLSKQFQNLNIQNYALVIGAGATTETVIFSLQKLQIIPIIFNRTKEKIDQLIEKYNYKKNKIAIKGYNDFSELISFLKNENIKLSVIISTIPGKVKIEYPQYLFENNPIIFEAAYFPKITSLIEAANKYQCNQIIYGIEMLLYQAFMQIEIYTGRKVDRSIIKKQILDIYEKGDYIL